MRRVRVLRDGVSLDSSWIWLPRPRIRQPGLRRNRVRLSRESSGAQVVQILAACHLRPLRTLPWLTPARRATPTGEHPLQRGVQHWLVPRSR